MPVPAIVAEATRRSGVVWVSVPGSRPRIVWHLWHEGAAYVVTGGAEQQLPGALEAGRVVVTVRSKDSGARLVGWTAAVEPVAPGSQRWDEVVPALSAQRLNAPDGPGQAQRWARESTVLRLVPTGELLPKSQDEQTGQAGGTRI